MNPSRVLFIGCDKGSWQMRGRQIAEALDARFTSKPVPSDWTSADVIVLVKRAAYVWRAEARATRVPLVWDVLDFWKQPSANQHTEQAYLREVFAISRELKVSRLIGATEAMAVAIGGVYLPHHCRIGLTPAPIRPRAETVAYDGSARYLGSWRVALERECTRHGLRFVVNPEEVGRADLLVAFRGEDWDGWVCRNWKSGVKYVNAIAAGRPIIAQACAAFDEIRPTGMTIEDPAQLGEAITAMTSVEVRQAAYEDGLRRGPAFTVDAIAARYQRLLRSVARRAA